MRTSGPIMKKHIKTPTIHECYDIMDEYAMLPNIMAHSRQVMNIALALTDNLNDRSLVNRELVTAAALLHDIAKTRTIESGELRHDLIGGDMMRALGFDDLASIIESHIFLDNFSPDTKVEEREIVFYADKRVMHDSIVSIEERIDDIVKRYGFDERVKKMILRNKEFIYRVEKKISAHLKRDISSILAEL